MHLGRLLDACKGSLSSINPFRRSPYEKLFLKFALFELRLSSGKLNCTVVRYLYAVLGQYELQYKHCFSITGNMYDSFHNNALTVPY
jgi:hypothetical protein